MEKFYPIKPYRFSNVLKDSWIMIGLIITIYGFYIFINSNKDTTFSLFIPIILLFKTFFDNADRNRLKQISFDDKNEQIIIQYSSLITGNREKKIPFRSAKFEVAESKSAKWYVEPISLNIMKGKKVVFEIKSKKDNLSVLTIQGIIQAAQKCQIEIVNL